MDRRSYRLLIASAVQGFGENAAHRMAAPGVTSGNLAPGRPRLAGSRRSTGRGVKKPGGEIDPFGMLQVGESGF